MYYAHSLDLCVCLHLSVPFPFPLPLFTDEGLALTIDLFHLVGRVNQYSAQSFIAALGDLPKFSNQPEQQKRLVAGVRKMRDGLDKVKEESLFNQLTALLAPYAEL